MCHIILAWFFLINMLFINYRQSCESLILSDNSKKKKDIQLCSRSFLSSSSLPLYINHPYSTHTFLPQTAQQFTEPLERMVNTPDTSLITSQANRRPCNLRCCLGYDLCLPKCSCQVCKKKKRY